MTQGIRPSKLNFLLKAPISIIRISVRKRDLLSKKTRRGKGNGRD